MIQCIPDIRKYPEFHRAMDEVRQSKQAILDEIHSGLNLESHRKIRTYVSTNRLKSSFLS